MSGPLQDEGLEMVLRIFICPRAVLLTNALCIPVMLSGPDTFGYHHVVRNSRTVRKPIVLFVKWLY